MGRRCRGRIAQSPILLMSSWEMPRLDPLNEATAFALLSALTISSAMNRSEGARSGRGGVAGRLRGHVTTA
jgi:hypothetical protein